jgi:hypothetical protein
VVFSRCNRFMRISMSGMNIGQILIRDILSTHSPGSKTKTKHLAGNERYQPSPQSSPHFGTADKPLKAVAFETAWTKAVMSGANLCSGMFGISS